QKIPRPGLRVREPFGKCPSPIRSSPAPGRPALPMLFRIGRGHEYLKKPLPSQAFLLIGITAPQEVGFREEIVTLSVQTNRRQTFAGNQRFHRLGFRRFLLMVPAQPIEPPPFRIAGLVPLNEL